MKMSDELRRQLRQVNNEQKSVDRKWRETLKRLFDSDSTATETDRAAFLGVPGRRQFFKIGGVTLLGATILAACGDDDDDTEASTEAGSEETTTTAGSGGGGMDLALAKTAASLEALAVATYKTAAESGKVTTPAVGAVATMFMDHHVQHQAALNAVLKGAGAAEITEPNAAVKAAVVDPVVSDPALDEAKIVKLAYDLETAAAQTYVFAAGALSTPELRSTIMTIGGIESMHAAVIGMARKTAVAEIFPAAFYKSDNPLPEGAVLS